MPVTYAQATALLETFSGTDPEKVTLIRSFMEQQQNGELDYERLTERQMAVRACNRSIESISLSQNHEDLINRLRSKVSSLEEKLGETNHFLRTVLEILDKHKMLDG